MHPRLLPLALWVATVPAPAQRLVDNNVNTWFVFRGSHAFRPRWSLLTEGQFRRHQFVSGWQQILLRAGLERTLSRGFAVSVGYTYFRAYPWGRHPMPAITNENRLHQQISLRHASGRWDWSHRLRLEERWINDRGEVRYQHRLRQQSRVAVPLRPKSPWWFAVSNEIWLNLPPNIGASHFDQDRLVFAIGRRLSPHFRIEFGYLYQPRLQRTGAVWENNHTPVVALLSSAPIRRF